MIRILRQEADADFTAQKLKSSFRFTGEQVPIL
jgi:hypothetical protein